MLGPIEASRGERDGTAKAASERAEPARSRERIRECGVGRRVTGMRTEDRAALVLDLGSCRRFGRR